MGLIFLVRHGATEANLRRPPQLQGQARDLPLADIGIQQASLTRDFLAGKEIRACYCSPLRRARDTARNLSTTHGVLPVAVPALTECNVGRWEGLDWGVIKENWPEGYQSFLDNPDVVPYPGGECLQAVYERVFGFFVVLLARHSTEGILMVTHQIAMRAILCPLLGKSLRNSRELVFGNCGITTIAHDGRRLVAKRVNDCSHRVSIVDSRRS